MAATYTIELENGTKILVRLKKEPVELTVELKDGKQVVFEYDPTDAASTIRFGANKTKTMPKSNGKYDAVVESDGQWVKYESSNVEGTEHK